MARLTNWLGLTGATLLLAAPLSTGPMELSSKPFWLAIAGAALLLVAPITASAESMVPPGALSPAEVVQKAEAAGYTNVNDIEFDDGRWEIEATSPAGTPVDVELDAMTGKVLHEAHD